MVCSSTVYRIQLALKARLKSQYEVEKSCIKCYTMWYIPAHLSCLVLLTLSLGYNFNQEIKSDQHWASWDEGQQNRALRGLWGDGDDGHSVDYARTARI